MSCTGPRTFWTSAGKSATPSRQVIVLTDSFRPGRVSLLVCTCRVCQRFFSLAVGELSINFRLALLKQNNAPIEVSSAVKDLHVRFLGP